VVVLAAIVITLVLARHTDGSTPRGARSAKVAATLFVGAINSGSGAGAAAVSCASFSDEARSEARSGQDSGITFSLGAVSAGSDSGTAALDEAINVGGSVEHSTYTLLLSRSGGLWLVCGRH
jgi:hypothetical protein